MHRGIILYVLHCQMYYKIFHGTDLSHNYTSQNNNHYQVLLCELNFLYLILDEGIKNWSPWFYLFYPVLKLRLLNNWKIATVVPLTLLTYHTTLLTYHTMYPENFYLKHWSEVPSQLFQSEYGDHKKNLKLIFLNYNVTNSTVSKYNRFFFQILKKRYYINRIAYYPNFLVVYDLCNYWENLYFLELMSSNPKILFIL